MKYYKLVKEPEQWPSFTLNKIYPGNYCAPGKGCSVEAHFTLSDNSWQEVPEYEYLIQESKMPDYRNPGTKLPDIPDGIEYRCSKWLTPHYANFCNLKQGFISFGSIIDNNKVYILAEYKDYPKEANNYYMIKLDDLAKLPAREAFVLPEKWEIRFTEENYRILTEFAGFNWFKSIYRREGYILGYDNSWYTQSKYPEITFEQFKKHILKEENMEKKKIIGYKLIKPECKRAAEIIMDANYPNLKAHVSTPICIKKLQDAGVLDIWFEPIYEQNFPIISVNGYAGEFFNWGVKFGCVDLNKNLFLELHNLILRDLGDKTIESVTIGKGIFTKAMIKEISEYFIIKAKNESEQSSKW
jgi:hypothetical protein